MAPEVDKCIGESMDAASEIVLTIARDSKLLRDTISEHEYVVASSLIRRGSNHCTGRTNHQYRPSKGLTPGPACLMRRLTFATASSSGLSSPP